jgi:elongation factor Ts
MTLDKDRVAEVRRRTNAAYTNVRLALEEFSGDVEAAVKSLQVAGFAAPEELLGRVATQGAVFASVSTDGTSGALVELGCETDFVARTEDFRAAGREIAAGVVALYAYQPTVAELLADPSMGVRQRLNRLMGLLGEKVELRRVARFRVGQ